MNLKELLNTNKLERIGRTYIENDKLFMNFSGSGVRLMVSGDVVSLKLFATNHSCDRNRPYISVFLNDNREDFPLTEEINNIKIKLPEGISELRVCKRTEASVSYAALCDLVVDNVYDLPEENKLNLEFYGDSITCGFGNLTNNPEEPFTSKTESFFNGYAYLTAKALNARYSAISVSGFPIYKSRWNEGFAIESVGDMLSLASYCDDYTLETAPKWDNKLYQPDIVVINLTSNDDSYFTEGQNWVDELLKELKSMDKVIETEIFKERLNGLYNRIQRFFDELFDMYGKDLKIVWAVGTMYLHEPVMKTLEDAIHDYNNPNVYHTYFDSWSDSTDRGAVWHPGAKMHINAANDLVEFIKNKVLGE